jgi:hypothetical protein
VGERQELVAVIALSQRQADDAEVVVLWQGAEHALGRIEARLACHDFHSSRLVIDADFGEADAVAQYGDDEVVLVGRCHAALLVHRLRVLRRYLRDIHAGMSVLSMP